MIRFDYHARPTFEQVQLNATRAKHEMERDRKRQMHKLARKGLQFFKEEAPRRTGRFVNAMNFKLQHGAERDGFAILSPDPLRRFIRFGTRPHPIVGSPWLSFYWEKLGRRVVFHSVNHPGTKPNRYVQRAVNRLEPHLKAGLNAMGERYIATLTG